MLQRAWGVLSDSSCVATMLHLEEASYEPLGTQDIHPSNKVSFEHLLIWETPSIQQANGQPQISFHMHCCWSPMPSLKVLI